MVTSVVPLIFTLFFFVALLLFLLLTFKHRPALCPGSARVSLSRSCLRLIAAGKRHVAPRRAPVWFKLQADDAGVRGVSALLYHTYRADPRHGTVDPVR